MYCMTIPNFTGFGCEDEWGELKRCVSRCGTGPFKTRHPLTKWPMCGKFEFLPHFTKGMCVCCLLVLSCAVLGLLEGGAYRRMGELWLGTLKERCRGEVVLDARPQAAYPVPTTIAFCSETSKSMRYAISKYTLRFQRRYVRD